MFFALDRFDIEPNHQGPGQILRGKVKPLLGEEPHDPMEGRGLLGLVGDKDGLGQPMTVRCLASKSQGFSSSMTPWSTETSKQATGFLFKISTLVPAWAE